MTERQYPKLFQYAIIWHPTEKQMREESAKSKVIIDLKTILAKDLQGAQMIAAMDVPADYREQIDQIEIAICPF
jgi:hypothetical protein